MRVRLSLRLPSGVWRTPSRERLTLLLGTASAVLLIALVLFGVWTFAQYEVDRLRRPLGDVPLVPVLRRDELQYVVDRLDRAPVLVPSPSPPPGRSSGRAPRGGQSPTDILAPSRGPLAPAP